MEADFPTVAAIASIESRQDEVLRKLDELEERIRKAIAEFGDQRFLPASIRPALDKAA